MVAEFCKGKVIEPVPCSRDAGVNYKDYNLSHDARQFVPI